MTTAEEYKATIGPLVEAWEEAVKRESETRVALENKKAGLRPPVQKPNPTEVRARLKAAWETQGFLESYEYEEARRVEVLDFLPDRLEKRHRTGRIHAYVEPTPALLAADKALDELTRKTGERMEVLRHAMGRFKADHRELAQKIEESLSPEEQDRLDARTFSRSESSYVWSERDQHTNRALCDRVPL